MQRHMAGPDVHRTARQNRKRPPQPERHYRHSRLDSDIRRTFLERLQISECTAAFREDEKRDGALLDSPGRFAKSLHRGARIIPRHGYMARALQVIAEQRNFEKLDLSQKSELH